jgi:hypothetical protein
LWRWIPESVAEFDDDLHDDPDHDDVWLTEFDDDHVAKLIEFADDYHHHVAWHVELTEFVDDHHVAWHVELTQFVNVLRRVSRVRRMHAFQR